MINNSQVGRFVHRAQTKLWYKKKFEHPMSNHFQSCPTMSNHVHHILDIKPLLKSLVWTI